jgi:hypothetical protein
MSFPTKKKKETPPDMGDMGDMGGEASENQQNPNFQNDRSKQINELLGRYIPTGKDALKMQTEQGKSSKRDAFIAKMKAGREAAKKGHAKPVAGVSRLKIPVKGTPAA